MDNSCALGFMANLICFLVDITRENMWDFMVLMGKETSMIWGCKEEQKESNLLLFMDCMNHDMNSNCAPKRERDKNTLGTLASFSINGSLHKRLLISVRSSRII